MSSHGQIPPGPINGLLQSWAADLKGWTTGIVIRYVVAAALLLAAAAGLVGAIAVGIAALFHWLEITHGLNTAYAAVAGLLVVLALVSAGIAVLLLTAQAAANPAPEAAKGESRRPLACGESDVGHDVEQGLAEHGARHRDHDWPRRRLPRRLARHLALRSLARRSAGQMKRAPANPRGHLALIAGTVLATLAIQRHVSHLAAERASRDRGRAGAARLEGDPAADLSADR